MTAIQQVVEAYIVLLKLTSRVYSNAYGIKPSLAASALPNFLAARLLLVLRLNNALSLVFCLMKCFQLYSLSLNLKYQHDIVPTVGDGSHTNEVYCFR